MRYIASGFACEAPYRVTHADLTVHELSIEWLDSQGRGHLKATSIDGICYKGTYGYPKPDPWRETEFRLFQEAGGDVVLFGPWRNQRHGGDGHWIFHLSPTREDAGASVGIGEMGGARLRMGSDDYELHFCGPFSAVPHTLRFQIDGGLTAQSGIYLFAVEYEKGYLINYVGETGREFAARFSEHTKWLESGKGVLNPDYLAKGENWLEDQPSRERTLRFFSFYKLFLASLDADRNTRCNIEQAIIHKLLAAGGKSRDFLGNEKKRPIESPCRMVKISAEVLLHGLGDHVLI
jgi:hypothetical protein